MTSTRIWCERALIAGTVVHAVSIEVDAAGRILHVTPGSAARPGDLTLGTVLPGMANAHSHAFHRVLRGRTHGRTHGGAASDSGDFWRWRERMYAAAGRLDPEHYRALAVGVFGEMVAAGWTAVGEFHYVHHRPDGSAYAPPAERAHAMELALVSAASEVGIRLVLLDTLYLRGGVDAPLSAAQQRFGDGDAARWLDRWHALREAIAGSAAASSGLISLGAAVHSTRAVPPEALAAVAAGLPGDVPVHVHVSEQPQENADLLARYGRTPVELLADAGLLSARLAAVHATHLSDRDLALLGGSGATVVMCPTTEADLGDGIGPARRLADAGARIALGSDQNAVVDPFLEMRGLEAGERLASGTRGRFSPAELLTAAGPAGYRALGLGTGGIVPGAWADLVEVDAASVRTVGAELEQLTLVATAADVQRVVIGGRLLGSGPELAARAARTLAAAVPPLVEPPLLVEPVPLVEPAETTPGQRP